jgi:hypothetical protein
MSVLIASALILSTTFVQTPDPAANKGKAGWDSSQQEAQAGPPDDPTAPLRRFPVSIMVRRPGGESDETSLLRLPALHPKDTIVVRVGDKLTKDWTLVTCYLAAGQKVKVESWNLWDKKWKTHPILAGTVPSGDIVPLFFLVMNPKKDGRVAIAIEKALSVSSEQIVSASAVFESTYGKQSRLLKFLTAYASLGPAADADPGVLSNRLALLDADLGYNVNPYAPSTTPGDLQRGLDGAMGVVNALRTNPDNPLPLAQTLQDQLPVPVADWLGLVSDLVHVLIKPRVDLKVTFIPASAADMDPTQAPDENWMDLVTERVPAPTDTSVAALVYHPQYERSDTSKPIPLKFAKAEVTALNKEAIVPIGPESRDLFVHPYGWAWEISYDKQNFTPLSGAKLVPGQGLEFPIDEAWWGGQNERDVLIRARIGCNLEAAVPVRFAKVFAQDWAVDPGTSTDLAVGDSSGKVVLDRSGGTAQPFYSFDIVTLKDASGKLVDSSGTSFNGSLTTAFDLAHVNPGWATVSVRQSDSPTYDPPVKVFIAPKRPNISIACATGDKVIRIAGPDAAMVTAVSSPALSVVKQDDSDPGSKDFVLASPVPVNVKVLDVTYHDLTTPSLEWHRREPVSFGLPRPKMMVGLVGNLPDQIAIGAGTDPSWAMATMPEGWFRTKQPIRLSLDGVDPFKWSHDVNVELGFGPAIDVQKALSLTEGPTFSIDATSPSALVTLDLETGLPKDVKRISGLLWFRATRGDIASPWTLATVPGKDGVALRAVRLPTVQSVETNATRTRITFGSADQILAVRFSGQAALVAPQLLDSSAAGLTAYVDAPVGTTEMDVQLQDAPDGVVHVKILKPAG